MPDRGDRWIVCQIGAREHYGVARALHARGRLAGLITDLWIPPGAPIGRLPLTRRLADRYHADLADAEVCAPNLRMLAFEFEQRVRKISDWPTVLARNVLFQRQAISLLDSLSTDQCSSTTLFSYSYAARDLFREAQKRGWSTVLGQIDPGPEEGAIVGRLRAEHPDWAGPGQASPPSSYWELWHEECALADRIVVNSLWSKTLVSEAGIDLAKITVIPLAYDGPSAGATNASPKADSREPSELLRVLYLGQAIVRKGIQDLASAAVRLLDAPIRIDVVGPHGSLPQRLPANLIFHGSVPRSEAAAWYRQADVFVLPTHSDGFALTQLEAMAHGLPVIATPACGEVVIDGHNGCVVSPGDSKALAEAITWMLEHPEHRERMKLAARTTAGKFGLDQVADALLGNQG